LLERLSGLGAQIRAGDFDLLAHISRGDLFGDFVGGLVIRFRDFPMAPLMFGHVLAYPGWQPDADVELQRHVDLRDGNGRVRGIGLSSFPADTGVSLEVGIALCVFPWGKRRHIGRWSARIKRAAGENDRPLVDYRRVNFVQLSPRGKSPPNSIFRIRQHWSHEFVVSDGAKDTVISDEPAKSRSVTSRLCHFQLARHGI
jgi:hypothetical protein